MLLLLAALSLGVPSPASAQEDAEFGFHIRSGDGAHMQAASNAGADFVVVVFSWRDIQPLDGYLYWVGPDAAVRAAEYYGLDVIARLDIPPFWAEATDGEAPWDLAAYTDFVRLVAERYAEQLTGVIIWNEPNLSLEWGSRMPDASAYVSMLRNAYPAVKSVAPDLPVAMAGLAFTQGGDEAQNDIDYLRDVLRLGGGEYFDVLAAHAYGFGQPPEAEPAFDSLNFRRLEFHRQSLDEFGYQQTPIWITEAGWRVRSTNALDEWQVVAQRQQAAYSQRALELVGKDYPSVERFAFWELNAGADEYGYALWQGDAGESLWYRALSSANADADPNKPAINTPIEILAADAIVRLGEIGTLHPHWVHLHRSEGAESLVWRGEFFLPDSFADEYTLLLETMQIDDPDNVVVINNYTIGKLAQRLRPDITSSWTTQRLAVGGDLLRPGLNEIEIRVGWRNPTRQYGWWRRENLQFRNLRLIDAQTENDADGYRWRRVASPAGWGEVIRLRAVRNDNDNVTHVWTTTHELGGLWLGRYNSTSGRLDLANRAGSLFEKVVLDVLQTQSEIWAATEDGVYRYIDDDTWLRESGFPLGYTHFVIDAGASLYAGVEGQGLWQREAEGGLWRQAGLDGSTPLDMVIDEAGVGYVTTNHGVFTGRDDSWLRLPNLPAEAYAGQYGRQAGEFSARIRIDGSGRPVIMNQNRLWRLNRTNQWEPHGPQDVQGRLLSLLDCQYGSVAGTDKQGLWSQTASREWLRTDHNTLDRLQILDGFCDGETVVIGTTNGVLVGSGSGEWQATAGLSATISDILILPGEPEVWLVATPVGVYRSQDQGAAWESISPPWITWDLAESSSGRIFAARDSGLAWTDDARAEKVDWHVAQGLESVTFLSVTPLVAPADRVWAGTWGNNIAVSRDGGQSIAPLHNGLETLSVTSVLAHRVAGRFTIGTFEGLWRTDDGGARWTRVPGSLQHQTVYSLSRGADGALYAGAADGLWRSDDDGDAWRFVDSFPIATVTWIGESTNEGGVQQLWAATEQRGVWTSYDDGESWLEAGLDGLTVYAISFSQSAEVLVSTSGGLFVGVKAQVDQTNSSLDR